MAVLTVKTTSAAELQHMQKGIVHRAGFLTEDDIVGVLRVTSPTPENWCRHATGVVQVRSGNRFFYPAFAVSELPARRLRNVGQK